MFIIILIAFLLLNLTIIYSTNKNNALKEDYFRIHVVANSDSVDDQILKLKVYKNTNNYISSLITESVSKDQVKEKIIKNLDSIYKICKSEITRNGYNYNIQIYIGDMKYDEKKKNNLIMQQGIYDSLKIVIGNGNGENFWSLIYPTNTQELIEDENTEFTFKIVELFKYVIKQIQGN